MQYMVKAAYPYSLGMKPLFQITPTKRIKLQLISKKIKPVTIDAFTSTLTSSVPIVVSKAENPALRPIRILNTGPAKHAVMALWCRDKRARRSTRK